MMDRSIADFQRNSEMALGTTHSDVCENAIQNAAKAFAGRLEMELRGAWRAGYDVLHVYDESGELGRQDLSEAVTLRQYVYPANKGEHRPNPPGLQYRYSFDLTSVPDEVIREVIAKDGREVSEQ